MRYGNRKNLTVRIDRSNGDISINWIRKVVDNITNPEQEILLKDARKIDSNIAVGDEISDVLPPIEFRRSMVQSARQIIIHKVKLAESYEKYKEMTDPLIDAEIDKLAELGEKHRDYQLSLFADERRKSEAEQLKSKLAKCAPIAFLQNFLNSPSFRLNPISDDPSF